jgi:thiosulfate reductase cytochrome b subunit
MNRNQLRAFVLQMNLIFWVAFNLLDLLDRPKSPSLDALHSNYREYVDDVQKSLEGNNE